MDKISITKGQELTVNTDQVSLLFIEPDWANRFISSLDKINIEIPNWSVLNSNKEIALAFRENKGCKWKRIDVRQTLLKQVFDIKER